MSGRQLLARRRALAGRSAMWSRCWPGRWRSRRAGAARPAAGAPRGAARPVCLLRPATRGRGPARYVPAGLVETVRRYLRRGEQVEAVLAEISAINAELLARRELE